VIWKAYITLDSAFDLQLPFFSFKIEADLLCQMKTSFDVALTIEFFMIKEVDIVKYIIGKAAQYFQGQLWSWIYQAKETHGRPGEDAFGQGGMQFSGVVWLLWRAIITADLIGRCRPSLDYVPVTLAGWDTTPHVPGRLARMT
jgi:hypothetical protein